MSQICPVCNNEFEDGSAACPRCGFHALGTTQRFKPISAQEGASQDAQELQHCDLKVVRGPSTGLDINLVPGSSTIGRDPQCDIFLNDMTVSRRHATLEVDGKGCVIRDENSFNGVWVNDRLVDACLLKSGDLIQIGVFCLVYRERA